jgi:hypothetical protein
VPRLFENLRNTRLIWLNVFRSSNLRLSIVCVGFRPFAVVFEFLQRNDTRNVTRRQRLSGFPPRDLRGRSRIVARTSAQTPRVEPSGC